MLYLSTSIVSYIVSRYSYRIWIGRFIDHQLTKLNSFILLVSEVAVNGRYLHYWVHRCYFFGRAFRASVLSVAVLLKKSHFSFIDNRYRMIPTCTVLHDVPKHCFHVPHTFIPIYTALLFLRRNHRA